MFSNISISISSLRRNNSHLRVDRVWDNICVRRRRHVHSLQVRNDNKDSAKFSEGYRALAGNSSRTKHVLQPYSLVGWPIMKKKLQKSLVTPSNFVHLDLQMLL